jgi:hypothetical protein
VILPGFPGGKRTRKCDFWGDKRALCGDKRALSGGKRVLRCDLRVVCDS